MLHTPYSWAHTSGDANLPPAGESHVLSQGKSDHLGSSWSARGEPDVVAGSYSNHPVSLRARGQR